MAATAAPNERSRLVWSASGAGYGPGDVVWAHRTGDFPGKLRPMLVVGRSGATLIACAFTTERHRSSMLVEASAANGLDHESWLSVEDEELGASAVQSRLGVIEPHVMARLEHRRTELRSRPKRKGGRGRR